MGAAVSSFKGSKALVVGRNRFIPVKKTNDLLAVWSDSYKLTDQYHLILENSFGLSPNIDLDERYFKTIDQLAERVKKIPSLKDCSDLEISGNVYFGENVKFEGKIKITNSGEKQVISNKILS